MTSPSERRVPVHYLRPNDTVWTPPTVAFMDTETATEHRDRHDLERLRLWSAHLLDRRPVNNTEPRDTWGQGDTAAQLADWLHAATRNRPTVWAWCHNLSFDLTTTRLPVELVARGWDVRDAAIGGKAPWIRLGLGKRVLTLVDSFSWLPVALARIGTAVGLTKPALPEQADTRAAWLARCQADVQILQTAICQLLDWWDAEQLGRWTISGASCGWNAYRHKQPTRTVTAPTPLPWEGRQRTRKRALDPILVNPDPDQVAADRLAVHGGRRGVWRIGEHNAGPFTELDFAAAYPTIAAELPLPAERTRAFDSLPADYPQTCTDRWGILARVRIRTDTPRWPYRGKHATWYPVGEFWTELAGPEIAEAQRLGCLQAIGPGHVHRLGENMAPWARWCLSVQSATDPDVPEVARLAAKSWGRAVIGKWASRGFDRVQLGPAPGDGWGYEEAIDHDTGTPGGIVDLAGQRWLVTSTLTPDNAYPAILAWVESHVRLRLARAIDALGPGAVLQCDTDGLIVAERNAGQLAPDGRPGPGAGRRRDERLPATLATIHPQLAPLHLRAKKRHQSVTVLGPQHLRLDGARRYSGLPAAATEQTPDHFEVKLWPKLSWQLQHGSPDGYVRPITRPVVKGPWPTGWLLADARVVPVQTAINPHGVTRVLPWAQSSYAAAGAELGPLQHPALAGLV